MTSLGHILLQHVYARGRCNHPVEDERNCLTRRSNLGKLSLSGELHSDVVCYWRHDPAEQEEAETVLDD